MKFGQHLRESIQPEWSFNYISYDELKDVLKTRTDANIWSETDEGYFVELLERELEKVYSFQNVKIGEVQRKLTFYNSQAQEFKKNGAHEDTWRALGNIQTLHYQHRQKKWPSHSPHTPSWY